MGAPHSRPDGAAYRRLAAVYDVVHRSKPYGAEARAVRAVVRRVARRPCRSLLDVACGSGRHLEGFSKWFECVGVDASPEMLALARRRVPGAEFFLGRMESFRLDRAFDVVTCLFSAVGYARSRAELRRTVTNLARHTAPGGVVVIEPWLAPSDFRSGGVACRVARDDRTTVLRMNDSRRVRGRSVFDFHYLIGRNGTVEHEVERHDLGLFSRATTIAALRSAGLQPRYFRPGLSTGRGLYVALRVEERPRGGVTSGRARRPGGR